MVMWFFIVFYFLGVSCSHTLGNNRQIASTEKLGKTEQKLKQSDAIQFRNENVYWGLVWSDEFEDASGSVNSSNWIYQTGGNGWGNQEEQFYTNRKENSRIENGLLVLEARKEVFENRNYTSARIYSASKWRYGRFEMRAKLPKGRGSWPAFWLRADALYAGIKPWPDCGELDIMEHVGLNPGVIESSVHTKAYNWMNKGNKTEKVSISDPFSQFHIYAVEWFSDRVDFFVDDTFIYRFSKIENADWTTWPFDSEYRIVVNNAIGGSWGGKEGIDDTSFPQKMQIDYVRVYQKIEKSNVK